MPIPQSLALALSAHVARCGADTVLVSEWGKQLGPWALERAIRAARSAHVSLLPSGHDGECAAA